MAPDRDACVGGCAARPGRDRRLGPAVLEDFRTPNVHLRSRRGFIADHLRRTGPSAGRPNALAIDSAGDDHSLARLEDRGGPADRPERPFPVPRSGVVCGRRAIVDIIGLGEGERLLPERELGAVGQEGRSRASPHREGWAGTDATEASSNAEPRRSLEESAAVEPHRPALRLLVVF